MKAVLLGCLLTLSAFAQSEATKPTTKLNLVDRLNQMTPEQRRKVLDRMPPERRKLLEDRIVKYNNIAPEVRERVRKDYEYFQQLSPEKQDTARQVMRDIAALPPDRRPMVRGAIGNLRKQTAELQETRLNSRGFQQRFSEAERKLIREALDTLPPSDPPPTQDE